MDGASIVDLRELAARVPGARPGSLRDVPAPEQPTLVEGPPLGDDWLHEIKLDGYRAFCRIEDGKVRLVSRRGLALTGTFPRVARAAAKLPAEAALLDGEVCVLVPGGRTSFHALQSAAGRETGELVYFAFDLLHLDGTNLCPAPLEERKRVLARLVPETGTVRYTPHIIGGGPAMFENACRLGLEGIVSKHREAPYRGGRSRCWLKSKCYYQQEFVVVGYTVSTAGAFGALLVGVHDDQGELIYAGRVGTGFSARELTEIGKTLRKLARKEPAFVGKRPGPARAVRWVDPLLVVEVRFSEWTADGFLRHPSFLGIRLDKPASSVVRERPRRA